MMKGLIFAVLFLLSLTASAQNSLDGQIDTVSEFNIKLIKPEEKLKRKVNFFANSQFSFNNSFVNGSHTNSAFRMGDFRPEIAGEVFKGVDFRLRTLPFPPVRSEVDNIMRFVDLAYVNVKLNKDLNLQVGKMLTYWAGYEFYTNPVKIIEFNDIVANSDPFLSGVQLNYNASARHNFGVQVLNTSTLTFNQRFGNNPNLQAAKMPLLLTAQWKGRLFPSKNFHTIWNVNLYNEAKDKQVFMVSLGNQLQLKDWTIQYDFKYSKDDLDRTSVVSRIVPDNVSPFVVQDARYTEHWTNIQKRLGDKWNLNVTGMVSNAFWDGNPNASADKKLRTAWGFVPMIEYFPIKNLNLKYFVGYVGRWFRHSDYAKDNFNAVDLNTSRLQIGIITAMPVF